jgi:phospholipid/cholesterol/gamma-HCH transport system substrate-binding protein
MPRTRSLAWSELKIGILAVIALSLAVFLVFLVGGEGGFFAKKYHLKTRFPNVMGLKEGGLVRIAGVEVGSIDSITFAGPQLEVVVQIRQEFQDKVTTDSRAMIGALSLLGEGVVDITASATGTPLPDWGYLKSQKTPGQLADVAEGASAGIEELTALLKEVRAGKGTVGKLFTDEQLYKDLNTLLTSAEGVVNGINRGKGTLGQLVNDPAAYRALRASLEDLQVITKRINAGEGSLGRLLNDDAFAKSLASTTANFDQLSARINKGEGTVGKLVTDEALYKRLDSVTGRLDALVANLQKGEGTAGQLLHDKQLYENMNGAANEIRSLIADIRKDPKKYLNVRVSIF